VHSEVGGSGTCGSLAGSKQGCWRMWEIIRG
jgi:hypothetical protein